MLSDHAKSMPFPLYMEAILIFLTLYESKHLNEELSKNEEALKKYHAVID
jgi:hypothetical protein